MKTDYDRFVDGAIEQAGKEIDEMMLHFEKTSHLLSDAKKKRISKLFKRYDVATKIFNIEMLKTQHITAELKNADIDRKRSIRDMRKAIMSVP
jgi:hypothetical protein